MCSSTTWTDLFYQSSVDEEPAVQFCLSHRLVHKTWYIYHYWYVWTKFELGSFTVLLCKGSLFGLKEWEGNIRKRDQQKAYSAFGLLFWIAREGSAKNGRDRQYLRNLCFVSCHMCDGKETNSKTFIRPKIPPF